MRLLVSRIILGCILFGSSQGSDLVDSSPSNRNGRNLVDSAISNDERDDESTTYSRSDASSQGESSGNRVSRVDTENAICRAGANGHPPDSKMKVTTIKYYYLMESSAPLTSSIIHNYGDSAFFMISPAVLWCTLPVIDVGGRRNLNGEYLSITNRQNQRHLSMQDARRLGIVSFSAAPGGKTIDHLSLFGSENDPCANKSDDVCTVIKGQMTVVAHEEDGLDLVIASIFDALEEAMDDRGLLLPAQPCSDDICIVSKIKWLGETPDVVIAGIEQEREENNAGGGDIDGGVVDVGGDGTDTDEEEPNEVETGNLGPPVESRIPVVLYAAIPMAILLAFAMLLAKNKKRRDVKTPAQLVDIEQDHVIVGTGDPPRCFHEGLYHYTRSGARYLSTNCADCAETRRIGFFSDGDLPTISERRPYDPESPSEASFSFDEASSYDTEAEEEDPSAHRKLALVEPSSNRLGFKHSAIDVHHCTSATCRICSYRPRDVSFVPSPSPSPVKKMFSSQDGLGDSCIV